MSCASKAPATSPRTACPTAATGSQQIVFQTDGTGRCLYTEAIDLSAVGRLAIARATTIAFDAAAQRWVVRTPEGVERFRHARREACVAWEHAALEAAETQKHESHQQGEPDHD